jgi:hypothetical protein
VLRILLRGIRTTLRRASPSATGDAQLGAVSFLQRFGSAPNPHFHVIVFDGVFSEGDDGSRTRACASGSSASSATTPQRPATQTSLSDGEPRGTATAADTDAADLPDSPQRAAARSR